MASPGQTEEHHRIEEGLRFNKRLLDVVENLVKQTEKWLPGELFPHASLDIDRDMIEHHELQVTLNPADNRLKINFKLTAQYYAKIWKAFLANVDRMQLATMEHSGFDSQGNRVKVPLTTAAEINSLIGAESSLTRVLLSLGTRPETTMSSESKPVFVNNALGLIEISIDLNEIGGDQQHSTEVGSTTLQKVFELFLELLSEKEKAADKMLSQPDEKAKRDHELARFSWYMNKPVEGFTSEELAQAKQVRPIEFNGYSTHKIDGYHHEIQHRQGEFALYSTVGSNPGLPADLIQSGGMNSTEKRLIRGKIGAGMCPTDDLESGGAANVFVRVATERGEGSNVDRDINSIPWMKGLIVLYEPSLLDRLDIYGYKENQYGATDSLPGYDSDRSPYQQRLTPEQLIAANRQANHLPENELMVRTTVPSQEILGFVCATEELRAQVLENCREQGVTQLNGKPIENCIFVGKSLDDFIDITKKNSKDAYAES